MINTRKNQSVSEGSILRVGQYNQKVDTFMITANVIHRIFRIRWGDFLGTAFTIDVDNKQYLVTAQHVVKGLTGKTQLGIFGNQDWKPLDVNLVGHCTSGIDISVLAPAQQLTPSDLPIVPSSEGLIYGQEVFFLGFPYNFLVDVIFTNEGYPLPFVKRATVSCFDANVFLLDGHNNPGFSGGPVVFGAPGQIALKVAAVISGFKAVPEPVLNNGIPTTNLGYWHNTGIIVSYSIKYALELIQSNPIGIEIK